MIGGSGATRMPPDLLHDVIVHATLGIQKASELCIPWCGTDRAWLAAQQFQAAADLLLEWREKEKECQ